MALLVGFLMILFAGCTQSGLVALDVMPMYNADKVNAHWKLVEVIDERDDAFKQGIMMRLMLGELNPTDAQKECVRKEIDDKVYWQAATVLALYHNQLPKAQMASAKAVAALDRADECIVAGEKI